MTHALPDATRHYINGQWVASRGTGRKAIVNPSNRAVIGEVALGDAADVEAAVEAAVAAFDAWSQTSVAERVAVLRRITDGMIARNDEMAAGVLHAARERGIRRWV